MLPKSSTTPARQRLIGASFEVFQDLEQRAQGGEHIELRAEEALALVAEYRSVSALLTRLLRVSDLTERQILDSRNRLRAEVLAARTEKSELQNLDSAKNDLLALAAHDLRSPVATIYGLAELLSGMIPADAPPEFSEFLADIRNLADEASGLVGGILEGYRVMEGNIASNPSPVRLDELLEEIVSTWTPAAELKDISLSTSCPDPERTVILDEKLFRRVADNLISNAMKHSPRGGRVSLALAWTDERLSFTVSDEGVGISDTDQQKLFKRFARIDSVPTGGEKSEGLGLALTATILRILQGQVTYERGSSGGSTFRVTIPCPAQS